MNASFQLIGLQHHGQTIDGHWDGTDARSETPLSEVLESLGILTPAVKKQMDALQLQRHKAAHEDSWWLYGGVGDWVCTLNGRALPHQQTTRLNDGDVIEIGFVRLQVKLQNTPLTHLPKRSATDENAAQLSSFELVDLALGDDFQKSREGLPIADDDISDLISDNVEDLTLQSPTEASLAADRGQTAWAADKRSADPLATLHEDYLRRLRSPHYNDPHDHWQIIQRAERMQTQDPLQHLQKLAGTDPGLNDLLGQSHNIQDTMASFDQLSAVNILAPEPFDSLMHLFAPEGFVPPHPPQVNDAPNAVENAQTLDDFLPGLTRREHHSLSLDSAMPIQKANP